VERVYEGKEGQYQLSTGLGMMKLERIDSTAQSKLNDYFKYTNLCHDLVRKFHNYYMVSKCTELLRYLAADIQQEKYTYVPG